MWAMIHDATYFHSSKCEFCLTYMHWCFGKTFVSNFLFGTIKTATGFREPSDSDKQVSSRNNSVFNCKKASLNRCSFETIACTQTNIGFVAAFLYGPGDLLHIVWHIQSNIVGILVVVVVKKRNRIFIGRKYWDSNQSPNSSKCFPISLESKKDRVNS